jgi:putative tryptophan/tyrosine transport system substrate-binding protein
MYMKRREFIALFGGAAAGWPLAARAQQQAKAVVGILSSETLDLSAGRVRALRQGLSESGYVEGRNVEIEYRWAENQYDRLPTLAADLVHRQVSVIATIGSTQAVSAAKAATATTPIVFVTGGDPVKIGLVASLNQPGGNLTGVTVLSVEILPKRLELLHELVPTTTVIAVLVNPTNPQQTEAEMREVQTAARNLGLQLHILTAGTDSDIDAAFAAVMQVRAGALLIGNDAFFNSRSEELAARTLRDAVPTIFNLREFTAAGGLMSYGASLTDAYRQAGVYIGRIVKGETPADLPVVQSTKVELFINLKTAKALGINVPLPLLGRADEVIE